MYAEKSRLMLRCIRAARGAVESGSDPMPFLDVINALVLGRGTHFYVSDDLICCNTTPVNITSRKDPISIYHFPNSLTFELDRITVYYPDGRAEITKDRGFFTQE